MQRTIIINSLLSGGAERTVCTLASHWASEGLDTEIVVLRSTHSPFYSLAPGVRLTFLAFDLHLLPLRNKLFRFIRLFFALTHHLRNSGATQVLSFMGETNLLTLGVAFFCPITTIVCERIYPLYSFQKSYRGGTWVTCIGNFLRRLLYRRANLVIVQTQAGAEWIQKFSPARITIIPNGVDATNGLSVDALALRKKIVLSVGRLVPQKRFDLLIKAFSLASANFPEWCLQIVGSGPLKTELQTLSESLGVSSKVQILNATTEISSHYRAASVFALTSDYEGMPNVLLEAMSFGCAVISTDCLSGPRDILDDGRFGSLVPINDEVTFAKSLSALLSDPALVKTRGNQALLRAQDFANEKILALWDETCDSVRASNG